MNNRATHQIAYCQTYSKQWKMKNRTVHQIAYCQTCGKQWEDYINHRARKAGYSHAKRTGHVVTVETGTSIRYN